MQAGYQSDNGYWGLLLGTSTISNSFVIDQEIRFVTIVGSLQRTATAPALSSAQILLQTVLPGNQDFKLVTPYLDAGLTLHPFPRKTFDPYVVFGVGHSVNTISSSFLRLFFRYGGRVNIGEYYVFLEQEINRQQGNLPYFGRVLITDYPVLFGAGKYF